MIIIGDTCTILYCVRSDLLQYLFDEHKHIYIPSAVNDELKQAMSLDKMLLIKYTFEVMSTSNIIDTRLDKGENQAINLYYDINADMLLTDDGKAIKYCITNNILVNSFHNILDKFL